MEVFKSFSYRMNVNRKQRTICDKWLEINRELYNLCLEQRKFQRINGYDQSKQLTQLKKVFPEYNQVYAQVLQFTLVRLENAFHNFFRRVKNGQIPGYPRFKAKNKFNSFTYPQPSPVGGFKLNGKYLSLGKIGNIKLFLSRELPPNSELRTCTIVKKNGNYYARLLVRYEILNQENSKQAIGIDVGITKFAALSDGTFIENPKFYEKEQKKLKRANRRLARSKKHSSRREKTRLLLGKIHEHIANCRLNFLHKESTKLARKFGLIAIENLNIAGMIRSRLARQISDVAWNTFFNFISYKEAESGGMCCKENPAYTSQTCPECGFVHKDNRKTQASFVCLACGYANNADTVGAINTLNRCLARLARLEPSDVNVGEVDSMRCLSTALVSG